MRIPSLMLKALLCAHLIAFTGTPLFAGVVFEVETTYHSGSASGRTESSEMSVEKPNIKMEIQAGNSWAGGAKDVAIFNGERRQMIVVNHQEKSYMVVDGQFAAQMGGEIQSQMQQAMKELEKQMEGLDPKQREMMEKMLKGKLEGVGGAAPGPTRTPTEYRRTSERATKQGYPCVRYDVLRDGEKVREMWVTDWNNVKGASDVVDVFQDMAAFYEELLGSFSQMAGGFGDGNIMDSFTKIDGFPVVTREFEGGELESETVLESVSERDLDPDAFEPPKGYRLRTMGPQ